MMPPLGYLVRGFLNDLWSRSKAMHPTSHLVNKGLGKLAD